MVASRPLRERQQAQLKRLLGHASQHVPFYKSRLGGGFAALADYRRRGVLDRPGATCRCSRAWMCRTPALRATLCSAARSPTGMASCRRFSPPARPEGRSAPCAPSFWQLMWSAVTVREHLWHGRDLSGKLAAIRVSTAGKAGYPDGERAEQWGVSTGAIFRTGPCVSLNSSRRKPGARISEIVRPVLDGGRSPSHGAAPHQTASIVGLRPR